MNLSNANSFDYFGLRSAVRQIFDLNRFAINHISLADDARFRYDANAVVAPISVVALVVAVIALSAILL